MVTVMEVEVLKKVGFRMPLYTPVYCIEVLIEGLNSFKITFVSEETENGEELHKASLLLLDIAYLKVCKIFLSNSSISLIVQFLNIFKYYIQNSIFSTKN